MTEFIVINAINTQGRTLSPDDDIAPLAKHIQESGQQVPILIDTNYRLIDGLRRLEAARFNGNTVIEVTIASIYADAEPTLQAALKNQTLAQPLTFSRRYEMYQLLIEMVNRGRSRATRGKAKGVPLEVSFAARERLSKILKLRSEAEFQAMITLFRLRDQGGEVGDRAQEQINHLEAGEVSPYGALARARKTPVIGEINNLEDQRNTLQGMVTTLSGVTRAITRMGRLNPRLSKEEVAEHLAELAKFRTTISRFVRTYTEENNQR